MRAQILYSFSNQEVESIFQLWICSRLVTCFAQYNAAEMTFYDFQLSVLRDFVASDFALWEFWNHHAVKKPHLAY